MSLPVVLRPPGDARELNFVRSSWTKSLAHVALPTRLRADANGVLGKRAEAMSVPRFFAGHSAHVDRVLHRAAVKVLVADATPAGATPKVLAGWICWEPGLLHYLYVAQTFRRQGLARQLCAPLAAAPMVYATWVPLLDKLPVPKAWEWDETRRWA